MFAYIMLVIYTKKILGEVNFICIAVVIEQHFLSIIDRKLTPGYINNLHLTNTTIRQYLNHSALIVINLSHVVVGE